MTEEEKNLRRESWHAKYKWLKCDIESNHGWDDLLDVLFLLLHREWVKMECHEDERFVVMQVKEKFGTLRVYTIFGNDFIAGMIAMAEQASSFMCEMCGSSDARLTGKGWLSTRCRKCVPGAVDAGTARSNMPNELP